MIVPDNEPAMTMATSVQHNLPISSAYSAPVDKTISDNSGPATAATVVDANGASEQNLGCGPTAEANNDENGDEHQDGELMGESSDEENGTAISPADCEATEQTPSLNNSDADTVESMGPPGVVAAEAVLNDSEVVANTQTALAPQDSIETRQVPGQVEQAAESENPLSWLDIEMARLTAPAVFAVPNPVNLLNNNAFAFAEDDHYPFNNHFSPENTSIEFDPFMGDSFNAYGMSGYFDIMAYPRVI